MQEKRKKFIQHTQKSIFSHDNLQETEKRMCNDNIHTQTHPHTHINLHAYGEKNLQIHPHHQDGIKQHHHEAFLKEKQKEKTTTTFPCRRRSKTITHRTMESRF